MKKLLAKYKWGQWTDLGFGLYNNYPFLLQARRRGDGKVQFEVRTTTLHKYYHGTEVTLEQIKNEVK